MKKLLLPLLALAALALPAQAAIDLAAIKPDGFAKGVVLTVDGYAAGKPALTNFPVLVRISESNETNVAGIDGFKYTDSLVSEGGDIRFADANGDPLPFEKDTWRGQNDVSLFWVTLPRMTNGTEFAMFYGASQNDANAFANPTDTSKTPWGDYTGVWHLGDPGNGSGVTISDSTTNALTGTTQSTTSMRKSDGAIGAAWQITDTSDQEGNAKTKEQINVSLSDSVKKAKVDALVPYFTVSLWYRLGSNTEKAIQWDYLIGRKVEEKKDSGKGWAIQMGDPPSDKGNGVKSSIRLWSSETTDNAPAGSAIPVIGDTYLLSGTWIKLDAIYDNTTYSFYTNGVLLRSDNLKGAAINGASTSIGIGGAAPAASGKLRPFTGDMDEVRLRRGTVSADWVAADYATQTSASFLSAGSVADVGASTKPIAEFTILDTGAAFIQVAGKVNLLGEGATECSLQYKLWADGDSEPAAWTQFASGIETGESYTNFVVGLDPLTLYHYAFRAANDLATPEYSDTVSDSLTTSGVGDAGESGGASERQLDEFVHTFTITERGVSTFEFTPPTGVTSVEALLVAGGGAGGYFRGGGGGGGGLVYLEDFAVKPLATYTVTVGAGGVAATSASSYGGNGGVSSISSNGVVLVSATGGGAGGNGGSNTAGQAGGSGGGSSANVAGGAGTADQGYAGAKGNDSQAGGGGGAAEVGSEPAAGGTGAVTAGGGGNGLPFEISGENVFYGGGGGGGGVKSKPKDKEQYGTAGSGGLGGGGKGGQEEATTDTATAESGVDGLGGGGGGGSAVSGKEKGGNGGNGVVIIRYGAGGDGDGVVNPTVSLTGLTGYDASTGKATVSYRVGWAGDGYDRVTVSLIYGYDETNLVHSLGNIATDAIGQGSVLVDLPQISKTIHVRLVATNSGNYSGTSPEIKSIALFNPAAPVATVSASQTLGSGNSGVSKADLTATVTDPGAGATSVNGVFQICPDKFFDPGTYTTFAVTNGPITATGDLKGVATGLIAETTYWVRAVLTNDVLTAGEPTVFDTEPVSFTTGACGWPWGRFVPSNDNPAFTVTTDSISAEFSFRGLGEGAVSGSAWMEVSATNNFFTITASSAVTNVVAADIPATCNFTVSGLQPNTSYYVRYRVRNNGGRETSNEKQWAFTTESDKDNVMLLVW